MTRKPPPPPGPVKPVQSLRELATLSSVPIATLRQYVSAGLLPAKIETFEKDPTLRARFIRALYGLGFTTEEIAALLRLEDDDDADGAVIRRAATAQAEHAKKKMELLRALQTELEQVIHGTFQPSRKRATDELAIRLRRRGVL